MLACLLLLGVSGYGRDNSSKYLFKLSLADPPLLMLSPPVQTTPKDEKKKEKHKENGAADEDETILHDFKVPQKPRRTLRAFIECGLIVGVSQANYWGKYINWIEDWQFQFNWDDQTRRLFSSEGWRFDSNAYFTNWGHALAGAVYYNAYRTNYLSWPRALLYSSLTSLYWELLVEWREVISINDNIFTMIGGFPIGEALFQTGAFLQSRNGWLSRVAGGLFNPMRAFNRWLDRKQRLPQPDFPWHQFRIYAGQRSGKNTQGEPNHRFAEFGLSSDLVRVPGYGRPGRLNEWRSDILSTRLDLQILLGSQGVEEFHGMARTVPWGWVWQDLSAAPDGSVRGHSILAGAMMAFEVYGQRTVWEYDQKNPFFQPWDYDQIPLPTRFTDKYSAVHLLGPRVAWRYHGSGVEWRAEFQASLDFAMTNAFALNSFTAGSSLEGMKSTLANYGYYYGLGLSVAMELGIRTAVGLEVAGWIKTWTQNSIEGMDRFANDISDDINIQDSRSRLGATLGYRIPGSPVQISLVYEHVRRRGQMPGIVRLENDARLSMHLAYLF